MSVAPRTVVLVDDDPNILRLVEKMLKPRPIELLSVPRPAEVLRICETRTVDVLISDIAMPEMDGIQLAMRVLDLQPETKILLISGHWNGDEPPIDSPRVTFLPKPFFPSDLVARIKELLP